MPEVYRTNIVVQGIQFDLTKQYTVILKGHPDTVRIRFKKLLNKKEIRFKKVCWSPKCKSQTLLIQNKKEIGFKKVF